MDESDDVICKLLEDPQCLMEFIIVADHTMQALNTRLMAGYYHNNKRVACYTSKQSGESWVNEVLSGHEERCFNAFRMRKETFYKLCTDLVEKYGLTSTYRMNIMEKLAIFLHVISKNASNRDCQERFQHSGETISRVFKEVLCALELLGRAVLRPRDPLFIEIPPQIKYDTRYMPYFKNCIGAIDGTHIQLVLPEEQQMSHRGRKGTTTMNVLAVCDFNLLFTYVLAGWEGSAHDASILSEALRDPKLNFPIPPLGKYYLADKGYANRRGFLTPYSKEMYHAPEWRRRPPRGSKEKFNRAHSSLRSAVERGFGVVKARWKILEKMPSYSPKDQCKIVCACFALNNFIRLNDLNDPEFERVDNHLGMISPLDTLLVSEPENGHSTNGGAGTSSSTNMAKIRDDIAAMLMQPRRE